MNFSSALLKWYNQAGRSELPWRQEISPYRVWISEIMLQQTQVTTVIPYFHRFISRFPDIKSLATASIDEVLQHWSGLGYYARGRNLHKTAHIIFKDFDGQFPEKFDVLIKLPGIGRSTAGAILSIAFQKKFAILDGNVRRILARYFLVSGWTGLPKIQEKLWSFSESILPDERIDDYTQAIMDLGAMICTPKKPLCSQCPVASLCQAYLALRVSEFPEKKPKKSIPHKTAFLFIIENREGEILLEQRPSSGIWGGLWSLPERPIEFDECYNAEFHGDLEERFAAKLKHLGQDEPIQHTFSHYHLTMHPLRFQILRFEDSIASPKPHAWHTAKKALELGLPAPIRKYLVGRTNGD